MLGKCRETKKTNNMKQSCLLKGSFKEGYSVEEAIMCVKSFDDVRRYCLDERELTKTQKRQVIGKLLKFSETYDEIWDVNECAVLMHYTLTHRQTKSLIKKLVWAAKTRDELKAVGKYARSKGLFEVYFGAKGEKRLSELL